MTDNTQNIEQLLQEIQTIPFDESELPTSPLDAASFSEGISIFFDLLLNNPSQLAMGWWLMMALVFISIASIVALITINYRRNKYRRLALKELNALFRVCDHGEFIRSASLLVKRLCTHGIHKRYAAYSGERWQQQLLRLYPKLSEATAQLLCNGQYQAQCDYDSQALHKDLALFIKHHKRNVPPC